MTISPQQVQIPSIDLLLNAKVWTAAPGTPVVLTYDFLQQMPSDVDHVIPTGDPAENMGWAPLTPAQQAIALQSMAEISAVANITFQPSSTGAASVSFGTDDQTVTAAYTYYGPVTPIDGGRVEMTQTYIEANNNQTEQPNEFYFLALHELANATGLQDFAANAQEPAQDNSVTYSIMSWVNGNNAYDVSAPSGPQAVTPQILDIAAWQYLYGANQDGFTPSVPGTTESHQDNNHTYHFSDMTAPQTIWIGANVSGTNCFDFSGCTGIVTIDLTPGTLSSTGQNPSGYILYNYAGVAERDLSNAPFQNVGIAYGTSIQIGIADNMAGATLIADATLGHANLLIGGDAADIFVSGGGTDIMISGGGQDRVQFHDAASDYRIVTATNGDLIVTDLASDPVDGTTILVGAFATLQFADTLLTESVANDFAGTTAVPIADTAANLQANLDNFEGFVSSGYVSSISLIDGAVPTLFLTASQTVADQALLEAIASPYSLTVDAGPASSTVTGPGKGHAVTVILPGDAAQYSMAAAGDGTSFSISNGAITDHMSGITAIQFADFTGYVASSTPAVPGGVSSAQVTTLYAAVLARTPDAAGLAFYQNLATTDAGIGITAYAQWFLSSPEYVGAAGHDYAQTTSGDARFITDTYDNLLHRQPEAGAVAWYQTHVIAPILGDLSPGSGAYETAELLAHATVLAYFSQSSEFLADVSVTKQQPADAQHWLILV